MASSERPIPRASFAGLTDGQALLVQLARQLVLALGGEQVPKLGQRLRRAEIVAEPAEPRQALLEQRREPCRVARRRAPPPPGRRARRRPRPAGLTRRAVTNVCSRNSRGGRPAAPGMRP